MDFSIRLKGKKKIVTTLLIYLPDSVEKVFVSCSRARASCVCTHKTLGYP